MPRPALKQLQGFLGSVSSSLSSVTATTTSTQLLAANTNRAGVAIFNASTAVLYLRLASGTASAPPGCSLPVNAGGWIEVPFSYSGVINGVWAAADGGMALITEFI